MAMNGRSRGRSNRSALKRWPRSWPIVDALVTEIAPWWFAPLVRELETAEQVVAHLEEVEARRGYLGHVGLIGLFVASLVPALLPVAQEAGPSLLGLADEDHVRRLQAM